MKARFTPESALTRKTAICNQWNIVAEAYADQSAADSQHLRHAGRTRGSLVADDHRVAFANLAFGYGHFIYMSDPGDATATAGTEGGDMCKADLETGEPHHS